MSSCASQDVEQRGGERNGDSSFMSAFLELRPNLADLLADNEIARNRFSSDSWDSAEDMCVWKGVASVCRHCRRTRSHAVQSVCARERKRERRTEGET